MKTRLNKYLAECGVDSRRKVEEYILQGRVEVNNVTITELAYSIDLNEDLVKFDGEIVKPEKKIYILLNKPKGFVTTVKDEKNRPTVIDLVKVKQKIFPVGRLDYNTTGVLLLTNDGEFTQFLAHPNYKIPRTYQVLLDKPIEKKDRERLLKGIFLDKKRGKFEQITFPRRNSFLILNVVSTEGRNHFVKNMFKALRYNVRELERIDYAGLNVKNIPQGAWRKLSVNEIKNIYKKYGSN